MNFILKIKWFYIVIVFIAFQIIPYSSIEIEAMVIILYFYFFSRIIITFKTKNKINKFISKITFIINIIIIIVITSIIIYINLNNIVNPNEKISDKSKIENKRTNIPGEIEEENNMSIKNKLPNLISREEYEEENQVIIVIYSISIFILIVNPFLSSYNFSRIYYSNQKIFILRLIQNFFIFFMLPITFWYILPKINKLVYEIETKKLN